MCVTVCVLGIVLLVTRLSLANIKSHHITREKQTIDIELLTSQCYFDFFYQTAAAATTNKLNTLSREDAKSYASKSSPNKNENNSFVCIDCYSS